MGVGQTDLTVRTVVARRYFDQRIGITLQQRQHVDPTLRFSERGNVCWIPRFGSVRAISAAVCLLGLQLGIS
ncbi:hypothetical protein DMB37_19460 [Nocardia sp. CS682]|nr:hypothetical protein DMB37_19460 [Nocardia sp. CS682]